MPKEQHYAALHYRHAEDCGMTNVVPPWVEQAEREERQRKKAFYNARAQMSNGKLKSKPPKSAAGHKGPMMDFPHPACPNCGEAQLRWLHRRPLTLREKHTLFDIWRCKNCRSSYAVELVPED